MISFSSTWMLVMIPAVILLATAVLFGSRHHGSLRHLTWRWNLLFIVAALGFLSFYTLQTYQQQFHRRTEQIEQEFLQQARDQVRQRASFVHDLILDEKKGSEQQLKQSLRQTVLQAVHLAETLIARYQNQMDSVELTRLVVESLRPLRYRNGRGYLFATRLDGTELLFADHPEYEGRNMVDMQDQDGVFYVREMIRLSRQKGEGFVSYRISQPGATGWHHKKIAYIHYVPELKAFIGTGEYLQSFEREVQQKIIDKLDRLVGEGPLSIFGASYEGTSLFGPAKGKNVLNVQDNNGIFVVHELIRTAKKGGGFVRYEMPDSLGKGHYEKISYCLPLEMWNCYVGAGIDLSFVHQNIASARQALMTSLRSQIAQGALFIVVLGFILWAVGQRLSRSIKDNVTVLNRALETVAGDGREVELDDVKFDEFIAIGQAANRMLEQRRIAEDELNDTRLRFRTALERAPLMVALVDPQRYILFSNSMWNDAVPMDVCAAHLEAHWFSEASWVKFDTAFDQMVKGRLQQERFDICLKNVQGEKRYYDMALATIQNADGENSSILVMARDITERRQAEERLTWLAHYDALTGLAHRNYAKEQLEQMLTGEVADDLWLLMFDINRFKRINEVYGHAMGDFVLKELAQRLQSLQPSPRISARLSSNEFIIVISLHDDESIDETVERFKAVLCAPLQCNDNRLVVDTRISGVSCHQVEDAAELLHRADVALREVKEGRHTQGFMVYDERLDQIYQENELLEKALRLALQSPEQFQLHFQPIWSLNPQHLKGFEALVRWQHPTFGLISPARFIPLAEQRALIVPLGQIIFKRACETLAQWLKRYPTVQQGMVRLSVNMAPQQFVTENFIEEIEATLELWSLPPEILCIEITETSLMEDPELAIQRIRALKEMGIAISIDDFGTGYSSLSYLQQFDVDIIKLDRSLVVNIAETHSAQRIIDAVVRLGHDLDLTIVAEGVETFDQLQQLRKLNCDAIQGYLTGKPCAIEGVHDWLSAPEKFPLSRLD